MSAMTPCPKDSPLMREWENYNQSDEYANSFKWAAHEEHRKGSMWAAFMAGFLAANPSGAKPMTHAEDGENNEGDLKRERDEAREVANGLAKQVERLRKERDELLDILRKLLEIIPEPECHDFGHTKEERHAFLEECPVMARYDALIAQAKEAAKSKTETNCRTLKLSHSKNLKIKAGTLPTNSKPAV